MPLDEGKPASQTPLLDRVNGPNDVHAFSLDELERLAAEIRGRIIETVMINGGHLASSLGVVELTLALHYVFDLERDWIIWDVGHQSYAHKLLTGRRDRFDTLRVKDGLSGYPRRTESPYDVFGAGHSSTSISAGLGMAVARDYFKEDRRIIAVIGDGAMTGGMAWEALSHAGHLGNDLIVILNDNKMSIAQNVGALSEYFSRLITGRRYKRAKEDVSSFVKTILGRRLSLTAHRLEQSVKGFLTAGGVFQELGFNYVGPVDGHDLPVLAGIFANMKNMHGPILFHCATQKGKGFTEAENDPLKYHGVKPSKVYTVENEGEARAPEKVSPALPAKTFTDVFAEALIEIAEKDPTVVAITAAMPTGTGLHKFQAVFPERFFDVSICEQHAVTFAAGLAAQGLRPVCALYSTFLQRGYDQVVHDVCLQNLPVVFAIDRAGVVGEDGPTHAGTFDLTFLRALPNMTILAPRDDCDLRAMLRWALVQPGPVAIRYPRDTAITIGDAGPRDITHGEILRHGADAMFLAAGSLVRVCLKAAALLECEGLSVGVADARWIKPLDGALLDALASVPLITVEENTLMGGFGSAVLEYYESTGRLSD
ncbi:MAG: 1-deoxy-D-xylulose-5-phosphate synthase, partial [Candidatus Hydrogenedentes bacterium]|nr:1-deoxy-D-xylulose-5-phosphate synthase [Candidatus Hydrogenedentota bacterium]